ncbi:hypothetical protein QDY71_09665 [Kingella negevensis]|uniref:Uncharacterized protein n=1 Tax=Kingella negevensis TaxID=1522312 RepID=A0A238TDC4_9NEIS|nr:hypothetical protein [Kingella negevensis]MDK4680388.1 hypothetical protein [Kingella negevensis]MDK4681890.1 hypothetical protein [Kingella negevensis]MDK4685286.1 hypothetical protein [Kingella negevensis]MDK4690087.1 hypothetical protein [Kingella negevensis]MDK4692567.1 hypothetical protein [Kingella negevensis]
MTQNKQDLILKITQVMRTVQDAKSSCSSAGFAETVDFFSKSKAASLWSTTQNYSMRNKLDIMKHQLKELERELKNFQSNQTIHAPDDLLDLFLDDAFDWNVDWLSLFNTSRTYDIERQCSRIYNELDKLLRQLQKK